MNVPSLNMSRKSVDSISIQDTDQMVRERTDQTVVIASILSTEIDCTTEVLVDEIDYRMVSSVITSWDQKIMNIPDWSRVVGERCLRHIFRIDPETITPFWVSSQDQMGFPCFEQLQSLPRERRKTHQSH